MGLFFASSTPKKDGLIRPREFKVGRLELLKKLGRSKGTVVNDMIGLTMDNDGHRHHEGMDAGEKAGLMKMLEKDRGRLHLSADEIKKINDTLDRAL